MGNGYVLKISMLFQYLIKQYKGQWEYKELTQFSFEDGCDELEIDLADHEFGNEARIHLLSEMRVIMTIIIYLYLCVAITCIYHSHALMLSSSYHLPILLLFIAFQYKRIIGELLASYFLNPSCAQPQFQVIVQNSIYIYHNIHT